MSTRRPLASRGPHGRLDQLAGRPSRTQELQPLKLAGGEAAGRAGRGEERSSWRCSGCYQHTALPSVVLGLSFSQLCLRAVMYTTAAVARGNFCRARTQDTYTVAASSSAAAERTALLAVSMGAQGADSWLGGHQGLGVPLNGVRQRLCMARRHRGCPRALGVLATAHGTSGAPHRRRPHARGTPRGRGHVPE